MKFLYEWSKQKYHKTFSNDSVTYIKFGYSSHF